jgi:hypothetical protein
MGEGGGVPDDSEPGGGGRSAFPGDASQRVAAATGDSSQRAAAATGDSS